MGIKQSRYHSQKQSPPRRESANTQTASGLSQSVNSITIDGRQYHNDQTSTYILPKDEIEQDRLNSQHFAVKALFNNKNILDSIEKSLPKGAAILDIGCGTGCWVMEMAVNYPEHNFTGVDLSDMFPTTIRPENAKFELMNVLGGLPFSDNTFDFVNMRFMATAFFYEMLKENDKEPLISTKLGSLLEEGNFKLIEKQEKGLQYKAPMNALTRELISCWKLTVLALKPLLAKRLVQNPDAYEALIDKYIEGLVEEHSKIKIVAYAARKITQKEHEKNDEENKGKEKEETKEDEE
ncbi:hypothetical protein G6F51_000261 [Rhizopus arrhizus]|uniref:Methyltransferase domain-containing protein n=1 Tax=Rhizopus oryzae TaxID=64495 RepID=A0A9P6YPG8_RHIOR|nr:hypothetical protein G6F51_000261 [Rhizopus arrhizus]